MQFVLRAKLEPPSVFGLPDGEKVVVPVAASGRTSILGPTLDRRTGKVAAYGTLSSFRVPEDAVRIDASPSAMQIEIRDNFLTVRIESDAAQEALDLGIEYVERFCQCASVQLGHHFTAKFESFEDMHGEPVAAYIRKTLQLFTATTYNLRQLEVYLESALQWANAADDRIKKALFYYEHATMLDGLSKSLPLHSPHASFSLADLTPFLVPPGLRVCG
jgi:hypothetical protein